MFVSCTNRAFSGQVGYFRFARHPSAIEGADRSCSGLSASTANETGPEICTFKSLGLCTNLRILGLPRRDMCCEVCGIVSDTEQDPRPAAVYPGHSQKIQAVVFGHSTRLERIAVGIRDPSLFWYSDQNRKRLFRLRFSSSVEPRTGRHRCRRFSKVPKLPAV